MTFEMTVPADPIEQASSLTKLVEPVAEFRKKLSKHTYLSKIVTPRDETPSRKRATDTTAPHQVAAE